jgi:mono/diheme cytochrome c family protein
MGFNVWQHLSDDDARAIVAYLRTTPAVPGKVDRTHDKFPFMGKMAKGLGAMHHKPAKDVKAPAPSDKLAYGQYMARVGLCTECHSLTKTGPDDDFMLAGSKMAMFEPEYGEVYARNLTPDPETGLGKYTAEQIKQALKSGRRLDGKMMAPPMSLLIPHLSTWSEEDLDAVVFFIKSVKPIKHQPPERKLTPEARRLVGE